jgi:uncharacterized protein
MRSTGVRAEAMDAILKTPLGEEEIRELEVFLMSDATPDDCMDIVTLDGFLTALAVGPELVPPSEWLPCIWGGQEEPVFESSAQAERFMAILMRRFNDICRMLGEHGTGFEPLLYTREVEGETVWIGEDWCGGFMEAVDLSVDEWQPLFDAKPDCALLAPILILGTDVGWEELEASADPDGECEAALEALGPSVEAIAAYWQLRWRTKVVASKEANLRGRALKPGRNDPCPCGSGRKFKKCCAVGSGG